MSDPTRFSSRNRGVAPHGASIPTLSRASFLRHDKHLADGTAPQTRAFSRATWRLWGVMGYAVESAGVTAGFACSKNPASGNMPHLAPFLCDTPAGKRLRHTHHSRAARVCRRIDDDDLRPCAEQGRARGVEPVGSVKCDLA